MAVEAASLSAVSFFLPIIAFVLVFVVIYALLVKTKVLGGAQSVMVFVSLALAAFFVVEASLVEWVQFSSAWISAVAIAVFFLVLLFGLIPGENQFKILTDKNGLAIGILVAVLVLFIFSSAYVFNWALNWGTLTDWFHTEWFGFVILLIVAAVVAKTITKVAK